MKKILSVLILAVLASGSSVFAGTEKQQEVNIYSYRQPFLIEPILEKFTKKTGIKTKVVFAKKGLIERLKREGKFSPADIVLTSDFSALLQLQSLGLSQPIISELVESNVPALYRETSGHWVALTKRVRNIYTAKRLGEKQLITYEDLADPKFKGKVCTRSGKHPYNLGLVSSMIAHNGLATTKTWLSAVKANLARRPQGNDRAQIKAIQEGLCDVSLGNSYYYGKMLQDEKQRASAEAVHLNFPNQKDRGSHINVSGVIMSKYAPNKKAALKLIEFLSSSEAQGLYASVNMEYPVKTGVKLSPMVASSGQFKAESLSLVEISKHRQTALKLIDQVKFDL